MNTAIFSGQLGKVPELKTLNSGTSVANFSVAVTENRRKAGTTDEWDRITHWIDCTAFGALADRLAKKARTGDFVTVNGRLRQQKWETEHGEKRQKVDVVAQEVEGQFQFRNADGEDPAPRERQPAQSAPQPQAAPQQSPVGYTPPEDDHIPF